MEQRRTTSEFIQFANQHPELTFFVTRIGCGIAGFTEYGDLKIEIVKTCFQSK